MSDYILKLNELREKVGVAWRYWQSAESSERNYSFERCRRLEERYKEAKKAFIDHQKARLGVNDG